MSLCLGWSCSSCPPPLSPPGPGCMGSSPSWEMSIFLLLAFFLFWMVAHLNASPPRPWREEVPEAKTGNLLVYYQLQNCCFDTRGPGGSHFLGFDNDLQTDLKSSKLIFPSPSWSRSANMMSLSPCVLKYDVAVPLRFVYPCQCRN